MNLIRKPMAQVGICKTDKGWQSAAYYRGHHQAQEPAIQSIKEYNIGHCNEATISRRYGHPAQARSVTTDYP
jgi:hypothetical protein